jgi:hypothetical protein
MKIEGSCNAVSIAFVSVYEVGFENARLFILITICKDNIEYLCGDDVSFCDLLCMVHFCSCQISFNE